MNTEKTQASFIAPSASCHPPDGRLDSAASSRVMESTASPLLTRQHSADAITPYGMKLARRRAQLRAAQARRRAKLGMKPIFIEVTQSEKETLEKLRHEQAGNIEDFYKRALIIGAKFLFNAGNRRGGKQRIKGGAQ